MSNIKQEQADEIEQELQKLATMSNTNKTDNGSQRSGQQINANGAQFSHKNTNSVKSNETSGTRQGFSGDPHQAPNQPIRQSLNQFDRAHPNPQMQGSLQQERQIKNEVMRTQPGQSQQRSANSDQPPMSSNFYGSGSAGRFPPGPEFRSSNNPHLPVPFGGASPAFNHPNFVNRAGQRQPNSQVPPMMDRGFPRVPTGDFAPMQQPGSVVRPQAVHVDQLVPMKGQISPYNPQFQQMNRVPSSQFPPNQLVPSQRPQQVEAQQQKPQPQLQNIVSTANLGTKLNLREIALNCRNAEYNPKRFAAVIMRIRDPKTTALIFSSGKMVCTGAKSEEQSKDAAKKYAKAIKKVGFPVQMQDFKVQNIVGSCDVQFPISLESLSSSHDKFSTYEPELFPGLIYRMQTPKIVLLIFASGKIVLTGAKNKQDIFTAFDNIYPVLKKFKRRPRNTTASTGPTATSSNQQQ